MKIKYNRFALVPHTCSGCGRTFWLEPYKYSSYDRFSPIGGFCIITTSLCKECSNKVEEGETE